jgi:hypothetical protein
VLPPEELAHLDRLGLEYEVVSEGGMICVIIHKYPMPNGYQPREVDLLLRLPMGFPDVPPDMWWICPFVVLESTGADPPQAEQREQHLGREWQRWSRHLNPGQWRPGRDSIQTFLRTIQSDIESGVMPAAA